MTYYDDYDFDYNGTADVTFAADTAFTGNIPFYRLKGKVTGTKTRVNGQISGGVKYVNGEIRIEGETVIDGEKTVQVSDSSLYKPVEWLTSVSFYDKYGRVIESIANNSLGGYDTSRTEYDFPGKVMKTKSVHVSSVTTQTVKKRFEYDHAGRLVKTYQKNNSDSEILLAYNQYNELGQLIDKSLHSANGGSSYLQSVDMRYNIRGWLKSINNRHLNAVANNDDTNDLFGMEFIYDWGDPGLNAVAQYNGNIADVRWKTRSTMVENAYGYRYDQLNQLKSAKFAYWTAQGWSTDNKYSTRNLVYDLNGNIKTMVQNFNGALADSLTYTYKGNILLGVNDLVNNSSSTNDFEDNGIKLTPVEGNTSTYEYLYDGNGNMIQDKNKNITVAYNFMNLPTKVNFGNGDSIVWVYSCTGTKLRKTVYDNGQVIKTLDYVNGFDYTNGKLDFFYNEQGRVKKLANGSLRYEYNITDHLGNSRVMFADTNNDGSAEILQESHYYAFGMRIEGLGVNNDNKYLYNGKELTDDFGLNWYEYGWRMYDGQLGRWPCVDPMDEFNSPYLFVKNNPIIFVDPDGKEVSIAKQLLSNQTFVQWANTSIAFKQLVGLFGKGGPLGKFTRIEINDFSGVNGQNVIRYNSSGYLNIREHGKSWVVDPEAYYSAVIFLNPNNWDGNVKYGGRRSGDHEIDHVMYSAMIILKAKSGEEISIAVGWYQDDGPVPNNGTDHTSETFLPEILKQLGIDKLDLPKGTVSDMIENGQIQTHDKKGFFEKIWNSIKDFFSGEE